MLVEQLFNSNTKKMKLASAGSDQVLPDLLLNSNRK